jgi:putative ABC transport system permease protein
MDPNRAVEEMETLASIMDRALAPSRLNAVLIGAFAILALVIAAVGILGMLAFSVSQRIREFGIRMALGADRRSVLRNVLAEGLLLVAVALVLGAGGAFVLGRALSALLFRVDPIDTVSFVAAASILSAVALGAALLPAYRATRIHPSSALKAE